MSCASQEANKEERVIVMSLLRSFSFGQFHGISELPDEVLSLFSSLVENPDKKIEFASEIISAGLQGNIDFGREFNIDAYEAAIRKNQKLGKSNKRKREVFLDFTAGDDDDSQAGGIRVDIASAQNVQQMEDAYEQLMDEDELRYAVSAIKSLQPVLMVEARLDLIYTIRQALKGIPDSVKMLRQVCTDYEVLGEQVQVVLGSGYAFEELFA